AAERRPWAVAGRRRAAGASGVPASRVTVGQPGEQPAAGALLLTRRLLRRPGRCGLLERRLVGRLLGGLGRRRRRGLLGGLRRRRRRGLLRRRLLRRFLGGGLLRRRLRVGRGDVGGEGRRRRGRTLGEVLDGHVLQRRDHEVAPHRRRVGRPGCR